jgi:hypothetical protein
MLAFIINRFYPEEKALYRMASVKRSAAFSAFARENAEKNERATYL